MIDIFYEADFSSGRLPKCQTIKEPKWDRKKENTRSKGENEFRVIRIWPGDTDDVTGGLIAAGGSS